MFQTNNSVMLRALEIDDYKLINKWRNSPIINKSIVGNRHFVSSEKEKLMVEDAIQNDRVNMILAICEKESSNMVGYTAIRKINWRNKSANWAGIIIGEEYWNKGYASAANPLILKFIFEELGVNRVYSDYLEGHIISEKMFKKMGFTTEGIGRQEFFKEGKYHNIVRVSLLKREYDEKLKG